MDSATTPADLARELEADQKRIRDFLRDQYPDHPKGERWYLDEEQAAAVRRRFRR